MNSVKTVNVAEEFAEVLNTLEKDIQQEKKAQGHSAWEPANPAAPVKESLKARPQIYVGNISYGSNEENLRNYFAKFGEIASLVLSKTKKSPDRKQGHRGFAFVAYVDKNIAEQVINQGNHSLMGRDLTVNAAKPKTVKFFVGGLNKVKTTEMSLRNYFSTFGEITDCFCVITRGFGFVTIIEDGDNLNGILEQGRHEIDGTMCDVKPAKKKEDMGGNINQGRNFRARGNSNSFGSPGFYGQQYNPYQGGNNMYNPNQHSQYQQQQPNQYQQNTWQKSQQNSWQKKTQQNSNQQQSNWSNWQYQQPQQNNQYQQPQQNNQYQQPQQNNQFQQQNNQYQQPQQNNQYQQQNKGYN